MYSPTLAPGTGRGEPPPHGPQLGFILVSFTLFTSKFTNILVSFTSKLVTVFVIFLHVVIQTCMCFFSRFLLSRNYKIQVIAHVGRKSAVVLSGIMEASYSHFFIGQVVNCSRSKFLLSCRKASKTITNKPPDTSRVEESDSPRRGLHD